MATESQKQRKREQREINKCELHDMCQINNIEVREITEYQIRLNDKLDIYVTSKKLFDLETKRWGSYENVNAILKILK